MWIGVLGPVEACVDDRMLDLGSARQRCVLVALLAEANQVVSADQLAERIWGDRLPLRAFATLRTYLSRLRAVFAGTEGFSIDRRSGGYVLRVEEKSVDLHRFHRLLHDARATDNAEPLDEALRLWRGEEAFAGLDTPWIGTLRDTLHAERFAAELDYHDAQLRRGLHTTLLPVLHARAARHPLDERLAAQLMVALYRSGRQADALDHYQRTRSRLAEELGAYPTPSVQRLHQQILTAHPTLEVSSTGWSPARARAVVPRQLPAPPRSFTGRASELATLDADFVPGSTVVISAIGGMGGIGKTSFALRWAHQRLDRFPDGQLFVNLRGFDPSGEPTLPETVLRGFLDALGVPATAVPEEVDAQVGLYRSLVADKQMLVVLDNAADAAQVTPLLPGSPTCAVLITSRRHLTSLATAHGARSMNLDVLTQHQSRQLLADRLGADRLAAEPHSVDALLDGCAGLPLAVGIVAARAAVHTGFPLAVFADELRDRATRLDTLDPGDSPLHPRAVFSWSYHALTPAGAQLFCLLGLMPAPDISLPAAAALGSAAVADTRVLLRELEAAYLLEQHAPNRYRMHDLVRLYAAERAGRDLTENARTSAMRRLVDFYLATAHAGAQLIDPQSPPVDLGQRLPSGDQHPLPDLTSAMAWFDAEHPDLLATQKFVVAQGWSVVVWQLAWALTGFHLRRGLLHDGLVVWRDALTAANRLGRPAAVAQAHRRLGHLCSLAGHRDSAVEHLERALAIIEDTDDVTERALIHLTLAGALQLLEHDDHRALAHATRASDLFQELDHPVWYAVALQIVAWRHALLGHYPHADTLCTDALPVFRRHHYPQGEAHALNLLGYIALRTGRHTRALVYGHQAIALFHDLGDALNEATVLDHLGETHAALGQQDHARDAWQRALELYLTQHRTGDVQRIHQQLDGLDSTFASPDIGVIPHRGPHAKP
ncbi:BTAD domain-containing putative transcriptional regulator [Nocardia sp. NPDC051052]|uniref:AfsR/SARP family transcriptional regulator n=1 Tax=Nocardia sp. NPDC051052 TaxID=3364322 RepID=UPI0037A4E47F